MRWPANSTPAASRTTGSGSPPGWVSPFSVPGSRISAEHLRRLCVCALWESGSARSGEALDRGHQLVDLLVSLRTTRGDRLPNAMVGVIGEQLERHPVEGPLDRRDLREHVDAIRLLVDHPPQ